VPAGSITTIYCACGPLFAIIYCACGFDYKNMLCLRAWSRKIFVPAGLFTIILYLLDCLQEFVVSTGLTVLCLRNIALFVPVVRFFATRPGC